MNAPASKNEEIVRKPPRDRILEAASALFYQHGIRAVGVESIAEAAGTNKMTLYRHFDSKDELVAAYLRRLAGEAESIWTMLETRHPNDPRAQLRGWLETMATHCAENTRGCALANAAVEIPEKGHPARAVIEQHKRGARDRLVALAREAGVTQPEMLADDLFLLLEGARVCAQSTGPQGPACSFVRSGHALIEAQLR